MLPPPVAQDEDAALKPSERLRIKVELAAPPLVGSSGILLCHPRVREIFPRYLAAGYHVTRSAVPLMETALARARELAPEDAVALGLVPYLERHVLEEMHGDEPGGAMLDDLEALGVDTDALRMSLPPPKIASLIGAQYYWILVHHPVAVLGYLQLEHFHARQRTVEQLITAAGLPREGFRQLLLHAELDIEHAQELDEVIDRLPLGLLHERLIGVSALHTIGLLSQVLLDVVEEKVTYEGATTTSSASSVATEAHPPQTA